MSNQSSASTLHAHAGRRNDENPIAFANEREAISYARMRPELTTWPCRETSCHPEPWRLADSVAKTVAVVETVDESIEPWWYDETALAVETPAPRRFSLVTVSAVSVLTIVGTYGGLVLAGLI